MTIPRVLVGALLLCLLIQGTADARKWTSRDGKFTIEAELADYQKGNVLLRRSDDKIVTVPLEKLGLADALYVQQALQALGRDLKKEQEALLPMGERPADPPPTTPNTTPTAPAEPAVPRSPGGPPLTRANQGGWQVAVDAPVAPLAIPANQNISIVIRESSSPKVFYPDASSNFVMIAEGDDHSMLRVVDLRTGNVAARGRGKLDSAQKIAFSPDGKLLACHGYDSKGKIEVFSFAAGKIVQSLALEEEFSSPQFLAFTGNDRIIAAEGGEKKMKVWDVATGKVVAEVPTGSSFIQEEKVALSPGGAYIAIADRKTITVLDTRNGEVAGEFIDDEDDKKYRSLTAMAFSPDGAEFAALYGNYHDDSRLLCWSAKDGKILVRHTVKEISKTPSGTYMGSKLEWFADKSAWYIFGCAVVDRTAGGPVFVETERRGSYVLPNRFVDSERVLVSESNNESMRIVLAKIPRDKFAAGIKAVAGGGTAEDAALPPLKAADINVVTTGSIETGAKWSYVPRAVKLPASIDLSKPFPLSQTLYGNTHFARADAGKVVIGSTNHDLAKRKPVEVRHGNLYEVYDLAARKVASRFEVPFGTMLTSVSPQGNVGVFALDPEYDRLDLFDLTTSKHIVGFRPYHTAKVDQRKKRVAWSAMPTDNIVVTLSGDNQLAAWKVPECQPLYSLPLGTFGKIAIDGSRQTLAVRAASQVILIDSITGRTTGVLDDAGKGPSQMMMDLAFRDDGQSLAAIYQDFTDKSLTAVEWDLATGTIKNQVRVSIGAQQVAWVGPRHIMLHGTAISDPGVAPGGDIVKKVNQCSLLDFDRKGIVWTYQTEIGKAVTNSPGDRHWYFAATDYGAAAKLNALSLPDVEAAKAIAKATLEPPIIGPGSAVALKVEVEGNFPASTDDKENRAVQVRDSVVKNLSAGLDLQKIKVDERSATKIQVTMREKSHTEAFELRSRYGLRNGAVLRLTVIAIDIRVQVLDSNGEVAWETSKVYGLDELDKIDVEKRPAGMTPENYVRHEHWRNAALWTQALKLPQPLYRNAAFQGLGESLLTPDGAQTTRTVLPARPGDKRT